MGKYFQFFSKSAPLESLSLNHFSQNQCCLANFMDYSTSLVLPVLLYQGLKQVIEYKFVLTIIPLQKKTNHVILLQQSTKTKRLSCNSRYLPNLWYSYLIIVLTIILLQTKTKHVIPLRQSTKKKQTILRPKIPTELVKLISDHVYFDQLRRDRSKRSKNWDLMTRAASTKPSIEKDFRFWAFHEMFMNHIKNMG